MSNENFDWRCDECLYGDYNEDSGTWECSIGIEDEEKCKSYYRDSDEL